MTNNSQKRNAADLADPELEQLFSDVYDAPPVPQSVLKRIDRGIQDEWGQSPKLVSEPAINLSRSFALTQRWVSAVPVAACAMALAALFFVFASGSGSSAWAAMVQALRQQGVVEIDEPTGVRWLSLSDGVTGRQVNDQAWMSDSRKGVTLVRSGSRSVVRRYRHVGQQPDPTNDQLLVSFLCGVPLAEHPDHWRGLEVVSESSEQVAVNGVDQVQVQMKFKTDFNTFDMNVNIDAETCLPLSCEVNADTRAAQTSVLRFAKASLAEVRQVHFPSDSQFIDVDRDSASMIAADLNAAIKVDADGTPPGLDPIQIAKDGFDPSQMLPSHNAGASAMKSTAVGLLKPATTWKAVNVVSRSSEQVLDRVDVVLHDLWKSKQVVPVQPATPEELMRRVYLDLAGRTPSVSEIRAYLKEPVEGRYEQLVDRLLDSPDHASHLAAVWRSFLIPEGVDLEAFGGVQAFDKWLAKQFHSNESYDELVRSLLLSEGRLSRSGPLLFYTATKLDPDQLASRTSRVFLGMRLECAQCHDHPFEPWTQKDFWSYAAFFAQISRPKGELETASKVMRVHDVDRGEVMLPETETVVPPRFLDGAPLQTGDKSDSRRSQLAKWLTGKSNPYFARATANRVWGQMFGAGIVNPIDDFGEMNPPVSPELLDTLASRLIDTQFDLKDLFRIVALSQAYRLSSSAATTNEDRLLTFAQMNIKTLTAEQIYDCITVASMLETPAVNDPFQFNVDRIGNTSREEFLAQFRTPSQERTTYQGGIPQALTLMNGALIEGATGLSSSGLLESLKAPFFTNQQRLEVLYLATLSRSPRDSEQLMLNDFVGPDASGDDLHQAMSDILWVLLNSAEFTLNH